MRQKSGSGLPQSKTAVAPSEIPRLFSNTWKQEAQGKFDGRSTKPVRRENPCSSVPSVVIHAYEN
jgi:hypothetical protein